MPPDQTEQSIREIMLVLLEELVSYGFQNQCVQASSLLMKVLHASGFPAAYPLMVGVQIYNEAFRRYATVYGPPHDDATHRACNNAGGARYFLGQGAPGLPEGTWAGHVVVITPGASGGEHAMIDLTINQARWPEFGIELMPLHVNVTSDFVSGSQPKSVEIGNTRLVYKAYPDDSSYNEHGFCEQNVGLDDAVSIALRRLQR